MPRTSVITVANEQVPIVTVCQMLGLDLPDDIGESRSRKVHCPFGEIYHSDHGASPAMRIYPDTNSVYCFSCAAYWTPVSLAAKAMDLSMQQAATQLLDRIGYKPVELAQQWRRAVEYEPPLDKALLADALKTFCRRIDACWGQRQFDAKVAAALTRCLSILDLVETAEDATLWLSRCKVAMSRVLQAQDLTLSQKYEVLLENLKHREKG